MGSHVSTGDRFSANQGGSGIPGIAGFHPNDLLGAEDCFEPLGPNNGENQTQTARVTPPMVTAGGLGPALAVSTDLADPWASQVVEGAEESDTVTCVFSWSHGGHSVFLTGSFNNWSTEDKVPLVKTGHDFITVRELPKGRHLYKFIVDDVWKYAPDQQTITDDNGYVNNVIDTTEHQRFQYQAPSELTQARRAPFHQYIPDAAEYTTDAPQIPVLFSKTACPAAHPPPRVAAPLHSVANHVYHDTTAPNSLGPHISVVATTHRWRGGDLMSNATQKYCTSNLVTLNPLFLTAMPTGIPGSDCNDPMALFVNRFRHPYDRPTPEMAVSR